MAADINELIRKVQAEYADLNCTLMEICGTHTNVIRKAGIHRLLPAGVRLLSGPGCPVCVTGSGYIEQAIRLSQNPQVIITTFGDLLKVPGNSGSLISARGVGAQIKTVYSPLDAVTIAQNNPDRKVVFLGVGFETTAPVIALAVKEAATKKVTNFSVLPALKVLKPALELLLNDPELQLDGLIAPGHLSVIIGAEAFAFLPQQFKLPTVVTGFANEEVWAGIGALLQQIQEKSARLENKYDKVVSGPGNVVAQRLLAEVFTSEDTEWRGLGSVSGSGLGFAEAYQDYDARRCFQLEPIASVEPPGCRCGAILLGKGTPEECGLFGVACTPEHPVGPCMVSTEGTCAAHFYYRDRSELNVR